MGRWVVAGWKAHGGEKVRRAEASGHVPLNGKVEVARVGWGEAAVNVLKALGEETSTETEVLLGVQSSMMGVLVAVE